MEKSNARRGRLVTLAVLGAMTGTLVCPLWPAQAAPPIRGMFGVGTWGTRAEFKDIKVTKGGRTLWASNFSKGVPGGKITGGQWKVVNGALRQTSDMELTSKKVHVKALAGNPSWSDYTLTLKARKLGGKEGFLIIVGSPGDDTKSWWNLGGWGNTKHALQMPGVPWKPVKGRIETGRWYNIRIELKGKNIKCYLNGKLVQQATR